MGASMFAAGPDWVFTHPPGRILPAASCYRTEAANATVHRMMSAGTEQQRDGRMHVMRAFPWLKYNATKGRKP